MKDHARERRTRRARHALYLGIVVAGFVASCAFWPALIWAWFWPPVAGAVGYIGAVLLFAPRR